jgi:hypothetical protein
LKRLGVGLGLIVALLLSAAPASAQTSGGIDPSRIIGPLSGGPPVLPADDSPNPVASCRNTNNTVLEVTPFGAEPTELPSLAACVSSLRLGRLSWIAYWQNCAALEELFALENETGEPYPYSFYGNPNYTAFNRLDCVFFVWSFHTGQLPPGPGV